MYQFVKYWRRRSLLVTDIGVGYLCTMLSLTSLSLRWCTQIRDFGVQHLCNMKNLQILSLAGEFPLINMHWPKKVTALAVKFIANYLKILCFTNIKMNIKYEEY